jgi:hypothetical protein
MRGIEAGLANSLPGGIHSRIAGNLDPFDRNSELEKALTVPFRNRADRAEALEGWAKHDAPGGSEAASGGWEGRG